MKKTVIELIGGSDIAEYCDLKYRLHLLSQPENRSYPHDDPNIVFLKFAVSKIISKDHGIPHTVINDHFLMNPDGYASPKIDLYASYARNSKLVSKFISDVVETMKDFHNADIQLLVIGDSLAMKITEDDDEK